MPSRRTKQEALIYAQVVENYARAHARLSVGDASAGVYILRVEAGKGSQVSKLIKVDWGEKQQ